jgi:hypothetical protein
MGELVDLKKYRLKKEAEEQAKIEEEIQDLREELDQVMARHSLSPNLSSYPVYPDGEYASLPLDYLYLSNLWPPYDQTHYDIRDEEEYYSHLFDEDTSQYYIDLRIKPFAMLPISED